MKYLLIGLLLVFSSTLYSGFLNCNINPENYEYITFMNTNGTYELQIDELKAIDFVSIDFINVEVDFIASIRLESKRVSITNRPVAMIYSSHNTPRKYFIEIYFSNKWIDSELEPCEVGEIKID